MSHTDRSNLTEGTNTKLDCRIVNQEARKGFLLPNSLPALPSLEGPKALLSLNQEQSLGYRIILGQHQHSPRAGDRHLELHWRER